MKPGFQCVRTHSKPGFMSSRRTRGAQIAVLAVPVLPESGSWGPGPGSDCKLSGIGSCTPTTADPSNIPRNHLSRSRPALLRNRLNNPQCLRIADSRRRSDGPGDPDRGAFYEAARRDLGITNGSVPA